MKIISWFFVLLAVSWIGCVQPAHITDKLLAGLYEKPASGQKPLQLLSSGTPVEVLEKSGGYQKVKLTDGTEGWVNGSYVTDEKPAQAKLLEAQAQITDLEERLAQAVSQACPPEEQAIPPDADSDDPSASQTSPAELSDEAAAVAPTIDCSPIEAELADVQARMAEAALLLGGPTQSAPISLASPARWVPNWLWLALASALVVGFALGLLLMQRRISKRFGKGFSL